MTWPIRAKEQAEADLFYGALGRCIAKWSEMEYLAGGLFWKITGLDREQAKAIFHSGQNWRTKTGMLTAALSKTPLKPGVAAALKAIVDRSLRYAEFRNIVAHDMIQLEPIWVSEGKSIRSLCLRPHDASLDPVYDGKAIRRENLEFGARNISLLTAIMSHAVSRPTDDQLAAPERLQRLVASLPEVPHLIAPDPSIEEQIIFGIEQLHFPK